MERLFEIQQSLKAPKNQYNKFGEYKYRSCEDILIAVKPLLKKLELVLIINDEILQLGDRYYIKATASLYDNNGKPVHSCQGFAREAEAKTKMDVAQITGAASSYARKYALNGLFLIDDVKDPDATNMHSEEENTPEQKEQKEEKPKCPMCGKPTRKGALEAWGCCSDCYREQKAGK